METIGTSPVYDPTSGQGQRKAKRPPGYRWLSVLLPQQTFNNLHIQARRSDMSFQQYMQRFCEEAFPFDSEPQPQGRAPEVRPEMSNR